MKPSQHWSFGAQRTNWWKVSSRTLQIGLDLAVLVCAFGLAYALRFDFDVPSDEATRAIAQFPLVVGIEILALRALGIHTFVWRYIGLSELRAFVIGGAVTASLFAFLRVGLPAEASVWRVPFSVIVMNAMLAFGGVLAIRLLRRVLFERYEKRRHARGSNPDLQRTLLVGAGRAGVIVAREMLGRVDVGLLAVGFVDDDPEKQGASVHGIKVIGTTQDIPRLVREHRITQVVVTIAQLPRHHLDRITRICESVPVKARIIPGLYEILDGKVEVSRIRDIQIEDLLGREQVQLDTDDLKRFIEGRTVLVTGAGGSIGSELCRQIVPFSPRHLILVERAEPALFHIDAELRRAPGRHKLTPLLADVSDEPRMRWIFANHRPDVVVHAAAHKHVGMMELNPFEAFKNNALATRALGSLAGQHEVDTFILVSTDKAVRPTSMMGASKRVAELIIQDLDRTYDTRFVAVRFGNVLGSSGSVIPIFREQIQRGGPITITHPDMRRYFMTIPEASQLVLEAGAIGEGGEIFVLDMGEPVRIVDLAERMVRLSGLRVHDDIELVFTGPKSGEKLFEELETEGENISNTKHPKIFIGKIAPCAARVLASALDGISSAIQRDDRGLLHACLADIIPEAEWGSMNDSDETASESRRASSRPREVSSEWTAAASG